MFYNICGIRLRWGGVRVYFIIMVNTTEFRCIGRKNINIYINRKYTLHSSPHQRHNSLDVFLYISLQPAVVIESLLYCLAITHISPSSIFYIEFCSKSTITIRECTIINILLKKPLEIKKRLFINVFKILCRRKQANTKKV